MPVGKTRRVAVIVAMMVLTIGPFVGPSVAGVPALKGGGGVPQLPSRALLTTQKVANPQGPSYFLPPVRSLPAPIGVASYGVGHDAGGNFPYVVTTNQVRGYFAISSLSAFNATFSSPYGASLQLNVMLRVNTTHGWEDLWLQNLMDFDTSAGTVQMADNIWNATSRSASISSLLASGQGTVASSNGQFFYVFDSQSLIYTLPLSNVVGISSMAAAGGVLVQFTYGGNAFDNVTITVPNLASAAITVTPYFRTGYGVPYDAELVWGGEYNSEQTAFVHMDSTLAIYYVDSSDLRHPFPDVYTYGSDTAEGADDLQSAISSNTGDVVVSVGSSVPGQLSNSFLPTAGGIFEAVKISFPATYLVNGTGYVGDSYFLLYQRGLRLQFYGSYVTTPGTNTTLTGLQLLYVTNGTIVRTSYSSADINYLPGLIVALTPTYKTYYRLTLSMPLQGSVDGVNQTVGSGWYLNGSSFVFSHSYYQPTGQGSRTVYLPNLTEVQLRGPTEISVRAEQETYLTLDSAEPVYVILNGRNASLETGWFNQSDTIQVENVTVQAGRGIRFVQSGVYPSVSLALSQPVTLSVHYTKQVLGVFSTADPTGGSQTPAGGWYNDGTSVQLGSRANPGWQFAFWNGTGPGAYSGNSSNPTIVLANPVNETATFFAGLSIAVNGAGTVDYRFGSIQGTASGTSTIYVPVGSVVAVSASAASFLYQFSGWSGALAGNQAKGQLTVSSPTNLGVNFGLNLVNLGLIGAVVALAVAGLFLLSRRRRRQRQSV